MGFDCARRCQGGGRHPWRDRPIANQYIVVLKESVAKSDVDSVAVDLAQSDSGRVGHAHSSALRGFSVRLSERAALALSQDPSVAYVEEDGVVSASATQRNPPWGLDRIDQRSNALDSAYTYLATGAGVHAYIIDTGLRTTHQEFGGGRRTISTPSGAPGTTATGMEHTSPARSAGGPRAWRRRCAYTASECSAATAAARSRA